MARLFVSFVHEDEKVVSAVQGLLQTELNLREEVFLSSDKLQIYAGDLWLQKIKEALSAAEIVILMLSRRSVARPWVNFEAGAAWLADKKTFQSATVIYRRMCFPIHIRQFRR
jgi:TIR domain